MTLLELIPILVLVESGGHPNPPAGDGGRALGPLQIHAAVVQDVNRIYGWRFRHQDARNPAIARAICYGYLKHWGDRLPHPPTPQDYARIWNGGPNGWKKPSTLRYWERVEQALRRAARPATPPLELPAR